jgi:hypothetical protein
MTASEILALADLLLSGLEKLGPRIGQLTQKGDITLAQQTALLDRIGQIESAAAFTDPAWQPERSD